MDIQSKHPNQNIGGKRTIQSTPCPFPPKKTALETTLHTSFTNHEQSSQPCNDKNASSLSKKKNPLVIVIAGPTGVGKSDAAFHLCQTNNAQTILQSRYENENINERGLLSYRGEIISADSVQAYQGVDIGANKPTLEEREKITHHLVDIVKSTGQYSAANWREDALKIIESIRNQNNAQMTKKEEKSDFILPIVVGGTMMYLQWLVHGRPDAIKPTPEAVEKAEHMVNKYQSLSMSDENEIKDSADNNNANNIQSVDEGWELAVEETSKLGPIFKQRVEKLPGKDWYRLRRTLEVAFSVDDTSKKVENVFTGERIDALSDLGYDVRCFFLCPNDRMRHCTMLDERCEKMLLRGLLKETADLSLNGDLPIDGLPAKAIGYRQVLEYLNRKDPKPGDMVAFDQFLNSFTAVTRQYSKKQMSWFRRDKEFMFIPVALVDNETDNSKDCKENKEKRVNDVIDYITDMCSLSREQYENELNSLNPDHFSVKARKMNTDQAKGMKVYQSTRYYLTENSSELKNVMKEADECTGRIQSIHDFHP